MFSAKLPIAGFFTEQVEQVSRDCEKLLRKYCLETVNSAEALSSKVIYIPVSALGEGAVTNPETGKGGVRPSAIRPFWITVPFLYAIQSAIPGLIPRMVRRGGVEAPVVRPLDRDRFPVCRRIGFPFEGRAKGRERPVGRP